jgi:hypothetical protein
VDKTSGETIEFSGSRPGRVSGNSITGAGVITRALETETVEIPNADIRQKASAFHNGEKFYTVETRDGKIYSVVSKIVEQGDKSILYVVKVVSDRVERSYNIGLPK